MDTLTPTPPGTGDDSKLPQAQTDDGATTVPPRGAVDERGTAETGLIRQTLLDPSVDELPSRLGLDMRLQRDLVHARLFGRPAGEHRMGRYLVRGTLGQGGMGRVLRAHDETLGRDVALKVLHEARAGQHEQRLLREAQALARLSHPNVVRVYDVSEVDGRLCMAMELVEGTPLHHWERTPRAFTEVLAVYLQAGRGLAAAHAEGLVHRDFKPANCIIDASGEVKVLDFGLARGVGTEAEPAGAAEAEPTHHGDSTSSEGLRVLEKARGSESTRASDSVRASRPQRMLEKALTRTGTMLGTLAYMAPEQLMGKPADPGSDQFAFCVSLYEAVYGKRPFEGSTPLEVLYAIQSQRLIVPAGRPGLPPVPRWLHEALRRGLSVASHQRYPSMNALLLVLERGLARRRRIRGAALSVVLLAGLGGALTAGGVLQGEQPCDGLRQASMPGWTVDDRRAVGEAIEGSGLPDAALARERVQGGLDAYATAWAEARADACEATWVRREAGEQALTRRMACLDDRLAHVRATVSELSRPDALTAAHAAGAVERLPALEPCADVHALLRGPAPVPQAQAEQAAEIRDLIARSWAFGATGHDEHGTAAAERAVVAAEAVPEAPVLMLEALYNRGHLLRTVRRWPQARQDLETALELAERLEDSSRTVDVLGELVLLADQERDASTSSAWLAAIRGKLARFDDQPRRVALRWRLEGLVALRNDRLDEAVAATERAVEIYEGLEPKIDAEHVEALILLGACHRQRKDGDAAEQALSRARELAEAGGNLPLLALVQFRWGHLHYAQGDLEGAREHLQGALATYASFYPTSNAASLRPRLLLAQVLRLQGELPRALEHALLARDSLDDQVPPSIRGELAQLLGSLHQAQGEWDEAIARYREARAAWEDEPGSSRVELAMLDSNTADCLAAKGDATTALALYEHALAVLALDTKPDDPRRAYPLFGRGVVLSSMGEREAGVASLRGVLALQAALEQDPSLNAELRWELGRALRLHAHASDESSREAGTLVREARVAFAGAGFTERVAEIDAWLEGCGSPCAPIPPTSPDPQREGERP